MSHGVPKLEKRHYELPAGSAARKMAIPLVAVGLLILGALFGMGGGEKQFYFSYLTAFAWTISIALGGMIFVLIHFVTRAGWSTGIRRLAENVMMTLPVFIVLAIPILFGMPKLYDEWLTNPNHSHLIEAKEAYLNRPFFLIRAGAYLTAWALLAWFFYSNSLKQDRTGDRQITRKLQTVAPIGIFIFAVTVTIASMDWLMSLSPEWFSTIWGVYYFAGCMIAIMATLSIISIRLRNAGLMGPASTAEHDHDLGKYLFAFTVFWSYIGFSQYMLIWYAQMPEETMFYAERLYSLDGHTQTTNGWYNVSVALCGLHFVVPFFFLMSRHIKRNTTTLTVGAIYMLCVHYLDMYWIVMPTLHESGPSIHLFDIGAVVGLLSVFVGSFLVLLGRAPMVPIKDPRLPDALSHENF